MGARPRRPLPRGPPLSEARRHLSRHRADGQSSFSKIGADEGACADPSARVGRPHLQKGVFTRTPWCTEHRLAMERDAYYQEVAETTGIRFERSLGAFERVPHHAAASDGRPALPSPSPAIPHLIGQMSHLWSKAVVIDVDMDIGARETDRASPPVLQIQRIGLIPLHAFDRDSDGAPSARTSDARTQPPHLDSARGGTVEAYAEARRVDQQLLPALAGGLYCKALTVLSIKG
jgi:hypothetical protein